MLDIGWSELLVVAVVAIVVVGPKELPKLMRTFGHYAGKLRRAAADFQRQFDEAMAESEAEEVRKNIEAIRANMGTTADFTPADKPLMTAKTEAAHAQMALGAPPLGAQQAEEPKRRKSTPPTKRAAPKRAAKPKPTRAKASAKTPAKARKTTKTAKTRKSTKATRSSRPRPKARSKR